MVHHALFEHWDGVWQGNRRGRGGREGKGGREREGEGGGGRGEGDRGGMECRTITSFSTGLAARLTWNLNNFLVGAEESSFRQLAPP